MTTDPYAELAELRERAFVREPTQAELEAAGQVALPLR